MASLDFRLPPRFKAGELAPRHPGSTPFPGPPHLHIAERGSTACRSGAYASASDQPRAGQVVLRRAKGHDLHLLTAEDAITTWSAHGSAGGRISTSSISGRGGSHISGTGFVWI